jgi:hypothetical protein
MMSDAASVALSPETVLAQMKANGVTDVVWLPDSETTPLTPLETPGVDEAASGFVARFRRLHA